MTEQQRVLMAVGLTFIIFWVWQVILGQIDPAAQMQPQELATETVVPGIEAEKIQGADEPGMKPAEEPQLAQDAEPFEKAEEPAVVVQKQSATLHSKYLDVSISNQGPSLNRVALKEYTEVLEEDGPKTPVSLAANAEGPADQAILKFYINGQEESVPFVLEKAARKHHFAVKPVLAWGLWSIRRCARTNTVWIMT